MFFPKDVRTNEVRNETDGTRKWEQKINRQDLKYEIKKYTFDSQKYETIRSFRDSIYACKAI